MKAYVYVTENGFMLNEDEFKRVVEEVSTLPKSNDDLFIIDHDCATALGNLPTTDRWLIASREYCTTDHIIDRVGTQIPKYTQATVIQSPKLLKEMIKLQLIDEITVKTIKGLDYPRNTIGSKMFKFETHHKGWKFKAVRILTSVARYKMVDINTPDAPKKDRITKKMINAKMKEALTSMKY